MRITHRAVTQTALLGLNNNLSSVAIFPTRPKRSGSPALGTPKASCPVTSMRIRSALDTRRVMPSPTGGAPT